MSDTIRVRYEIHADDQHSRGEIDLPSWCSGDPRTAVALHFFGYGDARQFVTRAEVVNEPLRNRWDQEVDADGELLDTND